MGNNVKNFRRNHYSDTSLYQAERALLLFKTYASKFFKDLNLGITSEQFVLLDNIYCNPGIAQVELSTIALKFPSNTIRILQVLENKGLITKKVGTRKNYLVKELYITEQGKELIDNNIDKIKNIFDDILIDFNQDEIEVFKKLVIRLQESCSKNSCLKDI